jgi:hypothetical protein
MTNVTVPLGSAGTTSRSGGGSPPDMPALREPGPSAAVPATAERYALRRRSDRVLRRGDPAGRCQLTGGGTLSTEAARPASQAQAWHE